MSSNIKRKLGWLPGSFRAATQFNGPYRGGPSARGAFDGGYDNGPAPVPTKEAPTRGKGPLPRQRNHVRDSATQTVTDTARPKPSVTPKPKPKHYKNLPFGVGDVIICSARAGLYRPCECGHIYMTVGKGSGQIPARLRCQRCGRTNRELRKAHVA